MNTQDPEAGGTAGRVEVRVRYAETDQMGRAYHTHYLVWCEVGRTRLLESCGSSYAALEASGVFLPVSRLDARYHRAARYEDRVLVTTRVKRLRSRSVRFGYRLHRLPEGELLAEISTELVCVDGDGKPRRIPREVREALDDTPGSPASTGPEDR